MTIDLVHTWPIGSLEGPQAPGPTEVMMPHIPVGISILDDICDASEIPFGSGLRDQAQALRKILELVDEWSCSATRASSDFTEALELLEEASGWIELMKAAS